MNDYLTLKNEQKFRVEVNWNSIADFCELQGMNDLSSIDNISKLKVSDLSTLIWACVREGERMDGNKFQLSVRDFSAKLLPHNISAFMLILQKQLSTGEKVEKTGDKKKVKKLFGLKH